MNSHRSIILASLGLLAFTGSAHAQLERRELPEGIRQLIRAADQAEQKVRRENGVATDEEAARQARTAKGNARRAIRDYWSAQYEYDRVWADTDAAWREAAEAQSHLLQVQSATIPDAARLQKAIQDRDEKINLVADAEFKLENARQALDVARKTPPAGSSTATSTTASRPITPQSGAPLETSNPLEIRFVYRNDQDSFHLLGRTGTASFARAGLPRLEALDFVKESAHFFFYRPHTADSPQLEWAFAKYAEMPGGDGQWKHAVWYRDRDGWHWEWTRRDSAVEAPAMPAVPTLPPAPPVPGPVTLKTAGGARSATVAASGH